ncbi:hypothetical protein BSZ22_12750 [Bradyrhizobium canariense]|nr:hypothetical protein BSZ22_12750 [Bradyrhizobium canariense]OSI79587.1 hypothetical protein BSZ23_14440 [Bradyrhizobium canariense]OSI91895.1 hypothetical protein BSZ25_14085 [Bradyrhizobium canariense]
MALGCAIVGGVCVQLSCWFDLNEQEAPLLVISHFYLVARFGTNSIAVEGNEIHQFRQTAMRVGYQVKPATSIAGAGLEPDAACDSSEFGAEAEHCSPDRPHNFCVL